MKIPDIIKQINKLVSNSSSFKLNYDRLKFYLDSAIDYINDGLLTNYPTIDEYWENNINYWSVKINIGVTPFIVSYSFSSDSYWLDNKTLYLYLGSEKVKQEDLPNYLLSCEDGILYKKNSYGNYTEEYYELVTKIPDDFDYNVIPDKYIRSCLIYKASALYLEEEDELEGQYQTYSSKANIALSTWKKQYYSMYECNW